MPENTLIPTTCNLIGLCEASIIILFIILLLFRNTTSIQNIPLSLAVDSGLWSLWSLSESPSLWSESLVCKSHITHHKPHITHHSSQATRHTSHITHHKPHVTHHTSLITSHTSQPHITHHKPHITHHSSY